jgi:methylmalonyl-CoA mutase N-terminal domain/subunit
MYRGRLFSQRLITGCPTPRLTNERLKLLIREGETALNIIGDQPTQLSLDSDHPLAESAVGRAGVPICSVNDMFTTMEGLPLDQVSTMLSLGSNIGFASYLVVAEKRGVPWSKLRGTYPIVGPGLSPVLGMMVGGKQEYVNTAPRDPVAFFSQIEWMVKNVPKFHLLNYNSYCMREAGVSAQQEMGCILANAFETLRMAEESGFDVEFVASRVTFTCSSMIDIFEEVAKFRAARRVWARTLKNRFRVEDPNAVRMKVHVNTGGTLMEYPQARINIVRGAYAALAAVLGGIQSLQVCAYDEPIAIPTEEAATMALRTEQILAHETGVTTTVDPLGGSYYVEALTDRMEGEIHGIVDEIEGLGGMTAAIESKWLEQQIEREWRRRQQEIERKERIVVGVNEFRVAEEEEVEVPSYVVDEEAVRQHIEEVRELKRTRSQQRVKKALEDWRRSVESGGENPMPHLMECCKAQATAGEVAGVSRMARGFPYDPEEILEYPF